ncbi:DMT family transporter [Bergeyella zoohelcum]|uniref:EamA family transporter n=1 Tax=Bergeyella zoohelcum TaxID=1015 RepID=UPI002A91899A|nr:DMT family transporter [Bergeyella zoohelcum]MDY6025871.1 DMT family transporter [Bergeyella zoohelcum]
MKKKGYFFAIVSAVSYGLIPAFIIPVKEAGFSLDKTLFYRFFISAIFLLAYLVRKKESLIVTPKDFLIMLILGLFYALSSEFLFLGYDYLSPGIASTILFVYPVIVALVMMVFFKETISKATVLSLILTILGVFVLSLKDATFSINFIGLSIALLSALFYALYIIIINKANVSFSGMKITFYSLLFSSLYYFIKVLWSQDGLAIDLYTLGNFTLFAFITTVISISTLVYAIQMIGSTPTSIMGALEPVVAVLVSVLFFQEQFTIGLFLGVMFIVIGVILNIISESKKQKQIREVEG